MLSNLPCAWSCELWDEFRNSICQCIEGPRAGFAPKCQKNAHLLWAFDFKSRHGKGVVRRNACDNASQAQRFLHVEGDCKCFRSGLQADRPHACPPCTAAQHALHSVGSCRQRQHRRTLCASLSVGAGHPEVFRWPSRSCGASSVRCGAAPQCVARDTRGIRESGSASGREREREDPCVFAREC